MSDFDKEVAKIQKYNQPIIEGFQAWLEKANLSTKTIKNHILNIEFFAEYLVGYEPSQKLDEADDQDVYDFLLNYFPRKALWASETSTKSYMGSSLRLIAPCNTPGGIVIIVGSFSLKNVY
jgi:hypothetical protein